ncbi:hypothetical protein ATE92_2157 [Ulvibacter sp. MAR_2010_11]|uniref:tRNA (guanine-N1)-methyltransferase n=1 Tax=Ulvibacter sp. MAR_2010_11 TaxID=1250229 RepID=UPI000C2CD21A|nr:tRNA (guanine-N1)-methyltransferase [Ulvibacter sp. MAR_2010_11]PKA83987.1 hypothetical protein ATE92_2157 [Ulvibacter sp. MAR_2010_11]
MIRKLVSLLPLLFVALSLSAQEEQQEKPVVNTLDNQFVEIFDKSNDYQEYKVVKKTQLNGLRKNVLDSVAALESIIDTAYVEINDQKTKIADLTQELNATQTNLANSKEKEDGIILFGVLTSKTTYNLIMWAIIGILLASLGLFVYKYRNSYAVTKEAKARLEETELEFEKHRQKTLEELQQLGRKLQDEINKNRKSK